MKNTSKSTPTTSPFYSDFVTEISKVSPASTFLTLKGYKNTAGEVADYSIVFNVSYEQALKKSISTLENMHVEAEDGDYSSLKAKAEILASLYSSLENCKNDTMKPSSFTHFVNAKGTDFIKGVKIHEASNTLYIYGLAVHKKVITAVDKKHKEKTVKQKLMENLPISRFRQFRITPGNVKKVIVQKISLLPPELNV